MDNFIDYLKTTKDSLEKDNFDEIHIVIGNESCDLDSCISSIATAFLLHNKKIPKISPTALVVPVQNISLDNFLYRTDNCFVLQEAGVLPSLLIYRDEVDFNKLLETKTVTTTLVDHHILSVQDEILEKTVIQIFDHRPIDVSVKWSDDIEMRIEQVGSCSTIVMDHILLIDKQILFKELAYMIYETIMYDTVSLLPEHGKAKELDIKIANILEKTFNFNEDRKSVFEKLWRAHTDISHLTPRQILLKDLKVIGYVPVPGLPMLVEDFFQLQNSYQAIKDFALEHNASFVLLIGLDATNEVRRDVGMFFKEESIQLKEKLLKKLYNSEQLKGYNFSFSAVQTICSDIVCLRQQNTKLSRKQIIPLLKDCLLEQ